MEQSGKRQTAQDLPIKQNKSHTNHNTQDTWNVLQRSSDLATALISGQPATKGNRPCSRPGPAPLLAFFGKRSPGSTFVPSTIKETTEQGHELLEHSWMSSRYCHPSVKAAPRQRGKHPVKLKHFLEGKLFSQVTQPMLRVELGQWGTSHYPIWVISAAWTWGNILQFNLWMCSRKPLPLLYSVYLSTEFLSQPSTAGK